MDAVALSGTEVEVRGAEEELIRRCQEGDRQAFNELFNQYKYEVLRTLRYILRRDDLDDIVQNVFIEIFKSIRNYRFKARFSTWLYRVCMNVAMQSLRKAKRVERNDRLWEPTGRKESPFGHLARKELMAVVEQILETMSPKKRVVFILHEIEELNAPEIGEIVGCSSATVRTRLFHARKEFYRRARKLGVLEHAVSEDDDGMPNV